MGRLDRTIRNEVYAAAIDADKTSWTVEEIRAVYQACTYLQRMKFHNRLKPFIRRINSNKSWLDDPARVEIVSAWLHLPDFFRKEGWYK